MEPDIFNTIDLHDATPELLLQLKLQIEKDLGLTGFQYAFEGAPVDLPSLVPELQEIIDKLKSNNSGDLMKIVYRVDLTEKQYKKVSAMPGEWAENLAKAIVLREFQKVVIRKRYKS
ncbi:MAG: hypothetical protein KG003_04715 [Bacteroidetes bacterium]|nr:hypothetical protein [Bacteroidota bacterium]